ncbi:MAG: GntR family transcriptional regulator [Marmoricola sp.]
MAAHSRYQELAAEIRRRIEADEWTPGTRLPRLGNLAAEYGADRDTVARAIAVLESEGYVWAVQGRGITVRHGTIRPRRPRGDLVKRNQQTRGYSFPSASSQEVWVQHGQAVTDVTEMHDGRMAKLLGVPVGSHVLRRFRVTGPASEAPFQINTSWIHPRVAEPVVNGDDKPAASEWLYRIEQAGHWPIKWMEFYRARMPTEEEATVLEIPTSLPVLEIVRLGRSGADSKPVEVTELVVASDRVETVHVLHRDAAAQEPWPGDVNDINADHGGS